LGDDLTAYLNFVNLARTNPANADTQFYIYTGWPWQTQWGNWNNSVPDLLSTPIAEKKQYHERLAERVSQNLGEHVYLIPVGEVLYRIDEEARAGNIPGLSNVSDLYRDHTHMNTRGSFVAGLSIYTTIFGEDPRGKPVPSEWGLGTTPAAQIAALQQIVWDVIGNHPYTDVVAQRLGDFDNDGDVDPQDLAIWQNGVDTNLPLLADGNGDRVVDQLDLILWENSFALHQTGFQGDYNGDRRVDILDYQLWIDNYGSDSEAVDGNQDGRVSAADYTVWRDGMNLFNDTWHADFNDDGSVDELDLAVWELEEGTAWDLTADANNDLIVDELDLAIWEANIYDPSLKTHGDFDGDGDVDLDDYDIWVTDFGKYFSLSADANGNRVIDNGDYDIWLANYNADGSGSGSSSSSALVPEPSSWALGVAAAAVLFAWPIWRRDRRVLAVVRG
jgi:hypothetical protein